MDTALLETGAENNCMSPPSPNFSLDSSSPFANGLHFESILFEDEEEEEEEMGTETRSEKPCRSSENGQASNTNLKVKYTVETCLYKGKSSKACTLMEQDDSFGEESGSNYDPASLVCTHLRFWWQTTLIILNVII